MSIEKEFYKDVDEAKKYNYWRVVVIVFWIALLGLVLGAYYYYNLMKIEKVYSAAQISDKDLDKITNIFKIIDQNPSSLQFVTITERELSSYLFVKTESSNTNVKNLRARIEDGKIVLYGRLLSPLDTTIEFDVIPEISDGKVYLSVNCASVGELKLSKGFINRFAKKYIDQLNSELDQPAKIKISNIYLQNGEMTVFGKLN